MAPPPKARNPGSYPCAQNVSSSKSDTRRIPISPHRFTPLKNAWISVYTPLVQQYVAPQTAKPRGYWQLSHALLVVFSSRVRSGLT